MSVVCAVDLPITSLSLSVGFKQSGLQVQGQGATPWLHFQSGWSCTRRSPLYLQRLFPGRHNAALASVPAVVIGLPGPAVDSV